MIYETPVFDDAMLCTIYFKKGCHVRVLNLSVLRLTLEHDWLAMYQLRKLRMRLGNKYLKLQTPSNTV